TVTGLTISGRQGKSLELRSRVVIAADGRYSRVARALGLSRAATWPRRWAIGAYFEGVSGMTAFGEMHVRSNNYMGIAPLVHGVATRCVVTPTPGGRWQPDCMTTMLRGDPLLGERFAGARMVTAPMCLGPLGGGARPAGGAGWSRARSRAG